MKTLLVKYCFDHIRVAILVKTLLVKSRLDHIRVAILFFAVGVQFFTFLVISRSISPSLLKIIS